MKKNGREALELLARIDLHEANVRSGCVGTGDIVFTMMRDIEQVVGVE